MLISFLRLKKIAVIAVSVVAIAFMLTHNPLSTTVQAAGTSGSSCTTEGDVPKLHTDGRWFKDEADNLVTLRGISFCGFNNEWGEKVLPDFKSKIAKVTNGTNGWYPNVRFVSHKPSCISYSEGD